jgi:hypothetical protein
MIKTNAAKFENGASRSHHAPHYDLVPKAAIDRLTKRLELGANIHGANNWKKGGPEFILQCKRHLAEHLFNFLAGDQSDDNLGAILCNAAFLAYFEEQGAEQAATENRLCRAGD